MEGGAKGKKDEQPQTVLCYSAEVDASSDVSTGHANTERTKSSLPGFFVIGKTLL
jgi:hypothetical protein